MSTRRRVTTKVVVLGDSGVGKTCLLQRYVNNEYGASYKATIGADFLTKELIVEDRHVGLQIWDTAGQERFHALAVPFYRGADACLLVFDITVRESFEHLGKWRKDMLSHANASEESNFPFVILGTKVDLEDSRLVAREEAEKFASELSVPYFEVSSKDNVNVEAAFQEIAIRTKEHADNIDMVYSADAIEDDAVVDLAKEDEEDDRGKTKKKGCCN